MQHRRRPRASACRPHPCVAAVCSALVAWLAACSEPLAVPDTLQGQWVSDSPAHADRYLEIGDDYLVFGTGSGGTAYHLIHEVETELEEDGALLWTLHYRDDDGETIYLRVRQHPDVPDSLRLGHRPDEWTRVTGAHSAPG